MVWKGQKSVSNNERLEALKGFLVLWRPFEERFAGERSKWREQMSATRPHVTIKVAGFIGTERSNQVIFCEEKEMSNLFGIIQLRPTIILYLQGASKTIAGMPLIRSE